MTKTMLGQVWTLVIDSGSGTGVRAFRSEEAARAALAAYVRDCWPAIGDADTQEAFDALPDVDAINEYFAEAGCDEWYVIGPTTVED